MRTLPLAIVAASACAARPPQSTFHHNDALARWMSGESIDRIAMELAIDRDEAKHEIRQGLMGAQTRYWRER